jgi:hypothetical protein
MFLDFMEGNPNGFHRRLDLMKRILSLPPVLLTLIAKSFIIRIIYHTFHSRRAFSQGTKGMDIADDIEENVNTLWRRTKEVRGLSISYSQTMPWQQRKLQ